MLTSTDFADIFHKRTFNVLNSHSFIAHWPSWRKHQCNDKQIATVTCQFVIEWRHTGFDFVVDGYTAVVCIVSLPKHGFVGYKTHIKNMHLNAPSWNVTLLCMHDWLIVIK